MENKFNNIKSKEWLPFQKSFTLYAGKESLIRDNLRFFTKPSLHYKPNVGVFGNEQYKITVQKHCEDLIVSYIKYWLKKLGKKIPTNIFLAGGLFANVRIKNEMLDR